jgi:hypothetical protein
MIIKFQHYRFVIEFERFVNFMAPPSFLLRALIGKELRYISCVLKRQQCPQCPLKGKCAYSIIFEVSVDKTNQYLYGRSNASPPFILNIDYNMRTSLKCLNIDITLVGIAAEYVPYLIMAVMRGGEAGIFKERIKYTLVQVECNGMKIDQESPQIIEPCSFDLNANLHGSDFVKIKFLSPFRYKKDGNYISDISFSDVITASIRRLNILSGIYGDAVQVEYIPKNVISEGKLYWKEESRYSARQQTSMLLGGVMGELSVLGDIEPLAMSLLYGAQIFNIGKNASFGLGNIAVLEGI